MLIFVVIFVLEEEIMPRRTRAKRKAKEKIISFDDGSDNALFSGDSDLDPAWSPEEPRVSEHLFF